MSRINDDKLNISEILQKAEDEAKKKIETWFSNKMIKHTKKYQKKYNFNAQEDDKEFSTHNNEADAFKHAFMQAWLTVNFGEKTAKALGDEHENKGNIKNQPLGESNMDLWNNNQGREIGKEIWTHFSYKNGYDFATIPYLKFNDIIAEKVVQRMRAGKLITNPEDSRRYKNEESHSEKFSEKLRQQRGTRADKYKNILENQAKKPVQSTGRGHWVTINGKHVFMTRFCH